MARNIELLDKSDKSLYHQGNKSDLGFTRWLLSVHELLMLHDLPGSLKGRCLSS